MFAILSLLFSLFLAAQYVTAQAESMTPSSVEEAFYDADIVPDIIPSFDPVAILNVTYTVNGSSLAIYPGINLTTADTEDQPTFALTSNNETLCESEAFVVVMIDPDAPYPSDPSLAEVRHFLGGDFYAEGDCATGATLTSSSSPLTPYLAPGPPADSPRHRYIQLLYIQPPDFDTTASKYVPAGDSDLSARTHWNLTRFADEVGLGDPIAGNFFYDSAC